MTVAQQAASSSSSDLPLHRRLDGQCRWLTWQWKLWYSSDSSSSGPTQQLTLEQQEKDKEEGILSSPAAV
jgi:hypothetical protein